MKNKTTKYMSKELTLILSFLFILCLSSFAAGVYLNSNAAFALSGIALLPLVGIFAVGVLDYKVGGSQLTLEKRVSNLEVENKELKEITTSCLKTLYLLSSEKAPVFGFAKDHYRLIEQYFSSISHFIDGNPYQEVEDDLNKINEKIKSEQT